LKRIISIFLLAYYAIGTICLPMGDFSSLQDVPEMYRYSKTTEGSDFNLFGFVAGHMLNIDGMADKRDFHDTQKSHASPPKHHQHSKIIGLLAFADHSGMNLMLQGRRSENFTSEIYLSEYTSDIFHPPTV